MNTSLEKNEAILQESRTDRNFAHADIEPSLVFANLKIFNVGSDAIL